MRMVIVERGPQRNNVPSQPYETEIISAFGTDQCPKNSPPTELGKWSLSKA
jgi:hypothetical protein